MSGFESQRPKTHVEEGVVNKEVLHVLPDTYFNAYKEANLMYPQHNLGIFTHTANTVLSDPNFDLAGFAQSVLSPEQLAKIKLVMNRTHAAHRIHAGSPDKVHQDYINRKIQTAREAGIPAPELGSTYKVIDDARLQGLWKSIRDGVIHVIGAVVAPNVLPIDFDPDDKGLNEIALRLRDPIVKEYVSNIFRSFATTLMSEAGKDISRTIKGNLAENSGESVRDIYEDLFHMMIHDYNEKEEEMLPNTVKEDLRRKFYL